MIDEGMYFMGILVQANASALADLEADIEAARLLVYNAARLREAGQPFVKQAAMAKLYSSQVHVIRVWQW